MRPTTLIMAAATGFAALPILSGPTWAQANRTFVSSHGSDANPCTLSAPCRSFAQALTQTNAGGEITILDPAGYGPVTITEAVSIINDGVGEAGVTTATNSDAIDVNIGPSDVVNLRGLTLVGGGVGFGGITFENLGTLNVQNCVIRGFTNTGLFLAPAGTAQFNISDTIVSDIGIEAVGITSNGSFSNVTAAFNRVQAIGGGTGFLISGQNSTGTLNVTIVNSAATNNINTGILSESVSGAANTQVVVTNTDVSNNGTGLSVVGLQSVMFIGKNTVAGNNQAFSLNANGALFSFGDNYIKGNGTDDGGITVVSTK